jgi:hypothetical protein
MGQPIHNIRTLLSIEPLLVLHMYFLQVQHPFRFALFNLLLRFFLKLYNLSAILSSRLALYLV